MEKNQKLDKKIIFKNYLRSLYTEINPELVPKIKENLQQIGSSSSWCIVSNDIWFLRSMLSYYLVSKKCPEFQCLTTADLVQERLSSDDNPMRFYGKYSGILILMHSTDFIRNKLMMETLLTIIAERSFAGLSTIVTSDKTIDAKEYTYYDHNAIKKYIPLDISRKQSVSQNIIHSTSVSRTKGIKTKTKTSGQLLRGYDAKQNREEQLRKRNEQIQEKQCHIE